MSAFDTLTAPPTQITAGEVVTWTETLSDYPPASYALAYQFFSQTPLDGVQQFTISASENGTTYTLATAATYKPGSYNWQKQITRASDSAMRVIGTGNMLVMPSLVSTQTVTFAASQVALLKSVIAAFSATDKVKVNFNGQEFERAAVADYQKQLTYYRAEVIREQAAWNALFGSGNAGNRITQQFVAPWSTNPFGQ